MKNAGDSPKHIIFVCTADHRGYKGQLINAYTADDLHVSCVSTRNVLQYKKNDIRGCKALYRRVSAVNFFP